MNCEHKALLAYLFPPPSPRNLTECEWLWAVHALTSVLLLSALCLIHTFMSLHVLFNSHFTWWSFLFIKQIFMRLSYSLTKSWEKGDKIFGLCVWFSYLCINNTAMWDTMDTYLSVVLLIANIVILQSNFVFLAMVSFE